MNSAGIKERTLHSPELSRKLSVLHRDLGWAVVMCQENVLSEDTFQRLRERFGDAAVTLQGGPDEIRDLGTEANRLLSTIPEQRALALREWVRFLGSVLNKTPEPSEQLTAA